MLFKLDFLIYVRQNNTSHTTQNSATEMKNTTLLSSRMKVQAQPLLLLLQDQLCSAFYQCRGSPCLSLSSCRRMLRDSEIGSPKLCLLKMLEKELCLKKQNKTNRKPPKSSKWRCSKMTKKGEGGKKEQKEKGGFFNSQI